MLDVLQLQSLATAELGNAIANFLLAKDGGVAVKPIQDLATDLPGIPLGKVSATQLGQLSAELAHTQSRMIATANAQTPVGTPEITNLSEVASQVGSLISLISANEPTATGGLETPDQAIAVQYLSNVSQGMLNGLAFWQGSQTASS